MKQNMIENQRLKPGDAGGTVFDIQRFSIHDGPGIRTLVFLKGCPLSCLWCANPESQSSRPQIGLIRDTCVGCGQCRESCPASAITGETPGPPQIQPELCNGCGRCMAVCPSGALLLYGRGMTAEEVLAEVKKDSAFYLNSGGGVTLSGGEPLLQPQFTREILSLCRQAGIHTAIETCGLAGPDIFAETLDLTDFILFDLKYSDSRRHRDGCGKDNALILENARRLGRSEVPFVFRVPLIPGYNDDTANLEGIASIILECAATHARVELMPYHRLGEQKYAYLGREYRLAAVRPPEPAAINRAGLIFSTRGITVL